MAKKSGNARGVTLTKIPIYDCNRRYLKQTRLKEALDSFSAFCNSHHENKTDVLFFMLHQNLLDNNDDRRHIIESLWKGQSWQLNPNQCLAMRIEILQSKLQYKAQYNLLKQMSHDPLQPPNALDAVEVLYTPPSARYSIEGIEYYENFYHTPAKKQGKSFGVSESSTLTFEPIDILNEFNECMPELATPNVKGVRWLYPDAIAKTFIELDSKICQGMQANNIDIYDPSILLKTSIKDGADGMGEVALHKSISDRYLPDKAFRFSFCVLKCEIIRKDDVVIEVFCEDKPNSVRTNRQLLEALCDENNHASICVCLLPIENERQFLKNKILKVQTENGWRRHCLKFYNSMIDEKLDRAESGLSGSGSKFLCTLCEATRETAIKI